MTIPEFFFKVSGLVAFLFAWEVGIREPVVSWLQRGAKRRREKRQKP